MKKILAVIFTAALMITCCTMISFASGTVVSSLHFIIDAKEISPGTNPDDIDSRNTSVTWTGNIVNDPDHPEIATTGDPDHDKATYPNLQVVVSDVQCTSPTKDFKIGDTVKVRFYVDISGKDEKGEDYYFSSSSGMHVRSSGDSSQMTQVSSTAKSKSGSTTMKVTVTFKALKGTYDEPIDLEWKSGTSLGHAKWSAPEGGNGSGIYDVRLKRDDHTVVSFSLITGTSLNLYPWMTKEGDYTFEVRTVPASSGSNGKKSDWASSDSQTIDSKHVSDGSGQYDPSGTGGGSGNTGGKVGWVKDGNTWYYIYPDGTMRKNGWEKVNNKWYYFDASGAMKTGWITVNNQTYYLDATNGDMKTGWVKTSDGQWYYLNPNPAAGTEGAMYKNQWLSLGGQTYFLKDTGAMATGWLKIDGRFYYFNPNEGGPKGAMLKNTRIDSFYLGADGAWVQGA